MKKRLLNDTFFEILSEVGAYLHAGILSSYLSHITLHHNLHEILEACGVRIPSELCLSLCRVTPEIHHVGGTIEVGRYLHERLADEFLRTINADTLLVLVLAFPLQLDADIVESQLSELANRVLLTSGNNEVLRLLSLKDEPHTLHVVLSVAPVTERVKIAEIQLVLLALLDASCSKRNLTSHESLAAALTLMVEEDTGAAEHVISLTILLHNPEAVLLSYGVGRIRMERSVLVLRNLLHLAVKLRSRSLIHTASLGQSTLADCLKDAEYTGGVHISSKLRRVEAHLHMTLSSKVIHLSRLHLVHHLNNTLRVAKVGIMKMEIGAAFQMSDALTIINGRTTDCSVHVITFLQQQLSQIRAILSSMPVIRATFLFTIDDCVFC